jgi:hypothetical protein
MGQCDEVPILRADFENGEGCVDMPANWNWHSAITRADLLKDWIMDLNEQYETALSHMTTKQRASS